MPLYDVEHTTPLSKSQRDALAQAITKIHSETFTTPKLFVNVRFVDLGKRRDEVQYIAGKEKVCFVCVLWACGVVLCESLGCA